MGVKLPVHSVVSISYSYMNTKHIRISKWHRILGDETQMEGKRRPRDSSVKQRQKQAYCSRSGNYLVYPESTSKLLKISQKLYKGECKARNCFMWEWEAAEGFCLNDLWPNIVNAVNTQYPFPLPRLLLWFFFSKDLNDATLKDWKNLFMHQI